MSAYGKYLAIYSYKSIEFRKWIMDFKIIILFSAKNQLPVSKFLFPENESDGTIRWKLVKTPDKQVLQNYNVLLTAGAIILRTKEKGPKNTEIMTTIWTLNWRKDSYNRESAKG